MAGAVRQIMREGTETMELVETELSREELYSGRVFRVTRDKVRLPDGRPGIRELVHSNGGVVILPVDEGGNVTLVRQFRYAQGSVLLEAVAGKLEPGEEPLPAAQRELREETGLTAGEWISLGYICTSPGFLTERLYLFLARDLTRGEQELDDGEFLRCEMMPLEELGGRIGRDEVSDGKTLAIYLKAKLYLEKGGSNGEQDPGRG